MAISEKAEKIIHDIPGRYYTIELDWKEVLAPITDYISTLEAENAALSTRAEKAEAMVERLIGIGNALKNNTPFKSPTYGVTAHEWDMAVSDWQSMPSHVTNPLDSQGIVTRNGGEG